MAKAPRKYSIADVLGFGAAAPRSLASGLQREYRRMPRNAPIQGGIKATKPTATQELVQLLTPNTRAGNEFANKLAPAVDMSPIGILTGFVDARRAYQVGNTGQAAGLGILAALGAVPGGKGGSAIDDVARYAERNGVRLSLSKRGGNTSLNLIEVPKEKRSSGIGSDIMKRLVGAADADGVKLTLTPDTSFGGTSKDRLRSFYKKFGFVDNKGRSKDFEITDAMYRNPQQNGGI